jgi:hypothetical protein
VPSLRSLIVFGAEVKDLGPVGTQPNLEELVIVGAENLADVSGLVRMPGLRALTLAKCEAVTDLAPLSGLKNLAWLSLPPSTTQEQFAAVCKEHPGLVVLQAEGCEAMTDLSPVTALANVQVLTAVASASPDAVLEAKSLRLFGVHWAGDEDDADRKDREQRLAKVMQARPDLVVLEVMPLCLGSGWILVLAPAAAAAWWAGRRRRADARDG